MIDLSVTNATGVEQTVGSLIFTAGQTRNLTEEEGFETFNDLWVSPLNKTLGDALDAGDFTIASPTFPRSGLAQSLAVQPTGRFAIAIGQPIWPPELSPTLPQMRTITDADAGLVLSPALQYLVGSSTAAPFTVEMPPWAEQNSVLQYRLRIVNNSASALTVDVNTSDAATTFLSNGAASITVAAGAVVEFATALDNSNQVWCDL